MHAHAHTRRESEQASQFHSDFAERAQLNTELQEAEATLTLTLLLPLKALQCNHCEDADALPTNTALCTLKFIVQSDSRAEVGAHAP